MSDLKEHGKKTDWKFGYYFFKGPTHPERRFYKRRLARNRRNAEKRIIEQSLDLE